MGTALIAPVFVACQANAMAPRVEVQAASEPPSQLAQSLGSSAAVDSAEPRTPFSPPGLDPATAGSIR